MQTTMQYANSVPGSSPVTILGDCYVNVARDLSRLNSKNEEVTTRDGHVFGYLCRVKIQTASSQGVSALVAPNSWKMRNAFRKFHAYRDIMFENIGAEEQELGRYGHTIRPLMDQVMTGKNDDTLVPFTVDSSVNTVLYDGGEWSYTQMAVTPTYEEGGIITAEQEWADNFSLMICEENVVQGASATDSGYYKRVGMIHSYNIDRMEVITPDADTIIDGPSNPLAQVISSGNQAAGEVLAVLEDQELEKPPYDLDDNGDSIFATIDNFAETPSTGGTVSFTTFVPAGLMRLRFTSASAVSQIEVEVLDKILCKDFHY